jgi:hypothetical protein
MQRPALAEIRAQYKRSQRAAEVSRKHGRYSGTERSGGGGDECDLAIQCSHLLQQVLVGVLVTAAA